jgi:hypothetical protein
LLGLPPVRLPGRLRTTRARLALFAALAAFGCLTIAGGVVFVATARVLGHLTEAQLRQVAQVAQPVAQLPSGTVLDAVCGRLDQSGSPPTPTGQTGSTGRTGSMTPPSEVAIELVRPDGTLCRPLAGTAVRELSPAPLGLRWLIGSNLPHGRGEHGERMLVLREPLADGWQLWIARDLSRDLDVLLELRGVLLGLAVVGGLVALGAGWTIARSGLRPVAALAGVAE